MDISVVICTYNGSKTITNCLAFLLSQETNLLYEIIVVDNNSNDNTFSLVENYVRNVQNSININLLSEQNAGKVNALRKGILVSSGELVIICDDDNYLSKNFLEVAFELFKKNPQCGAACGRNSAISDIPFPDWFKDYEILYGCGSLLNGTGEVNNLWGAGMVIRGDLIRNLYASGLVHLLGTKYENDNRYNSVRLCGEDNELCFWIKLLGHKLYYVEDLKLEHAIPAQRLTIQYRDNLLRGIQMSNDIFKSKNGLIKSALKKVRKKDFLNVFLPTEEGAVSRLKLGFIRKGELYHNYSILKKKTNKLKRVLIIASWYDPNNNVGSFFRVQAEILATKYEVTMCFPSDGVNNYEFKGLKLFSYKKINTKLSSSKLDALRAKYQLQKTAEVIMRNGEFDVCIAQNIITAGFIAYELKKKYNIPYITIHHNPYMPGLNYFSNNWRIGRIMKNSLENFVVSNDLLRHFRIAGRSEKIQVIHNPVNVNFEIPTRKDKIANHITIAISGQFNVKFNHELFFTSLNYVNHETLQKLKIVWLGYNSWGGNLIDEDVLVGIKKALPNFDLNIELYSSLQKQEMMYYLAHSDLYVHTSFTETFGITSLEAMKLGVPVLSTQNGGINEYVLPNVNGVVINSFEPNIFGKGLQNILNNLNKYDRQVIQSSVENVATEKEFLRVLTETIG